MHTRWLIILVAVGMLVIPVSAATSVGADFQVRNHDRLQRIYPMSYSPPRTALGPIKLAGVRNGTFAGQVIVCGTERIKGLKVVAGDLTGAGTIPAKAITIRYAMPDGAPRRRNETGAFDSLEDFPPASVRRYRKSRRSIQPIWVTVRVPANARPGNYSGTIRISADAAKTVTVPLKLRVIDWALPHPNAFAAHMDIVQSPESVAMGYGVKLWSEDHFRLLDKSFALLKPLANKTVYITVVRRTHFGNEHAMVRWVRDKDGVYQPKFDIVEKYLDVAMKHLGKVPAVVLYCWEATSSMGHAGGTGGAGRTHDRPILLTLLDPKTGRLKKRTGPAWGTPEAKQFWGRFNKGMIKVLRKRGIEKSMLFGLIGDVRPTKQAMDDIRSGVKNPRWAVHSHYYCVNWQGYKVAMTVAMWGIHLNIVDPKQGRGYGWRNPYWLAYYPREMSLQTALPQYRYKLEMWVGALSLHEMRQSGKSRGARGLGRLGADFWVVMKDHRGRLRSRLPGRYPESYWGQMNLSYGIPHLFGKGKNGPVPTVRSEAFRENIQEIEARISIEKVLLDKAGRAKLGKELATRCRATLDDRIRMVNRAGKARTDQGGTKGSAGGVPADWRQKNAKLFELAAEVAGKLGN